MLFNLLDEKWIPVLWNNGTVSRVGIKETLTQAHRIRQIATSNPMDRVAIIRFLLALLYWCKGNPPADGDIVSGKSFPADWFSKLDDNKDCFNLLGEGKRFYQYRKTDGDDTEKLSANYLIQEIPTGRNLWHFRHSTDEVDGLCQACCAMGLLRLPLFATSGGRGKPPGINSKPPTYVLPVGVSLVETLRLSWRQMSNSDLGTSGWEKPDLLLPKAGHIPLLAGLTWVPRRVWLDDPDQSATFCVSCGRKEHVIRKIVFAGIGSQKTDEDSQPRDWRDPHVIYQKDETQSLHAADTLGASDASAKQWMKIFAGTPRNNDKGNIWVVGFASVQNDKYLEAMEFLIPFNSQQQGIPESLEKMEKWQKENKNLAGKAKPPAKESPRKHSEVAPMIAAIRPHVEAIVSAKAGELLAGGDAAWEKAAEEYRPMMEVIAKSLSPGFTTAALQRRNRIANTLPDMRPKSEPAKKPARKKGESK